MTAAPNLAAAADDFENCYGIAKAGENDCASTGLSLSLRDYFPPQRTAWLTYRWGKMADFTESDKPDAQNRCMQADNCDAIGRTRNVFN